MKIEDKLNEYLVKGGKEKGLSTVFKRKFNIDVKKVEVEKITTFTFKNGIDEQDWSNFNTIDEIHKMFKKIYPKGLITHDYDRFIIKEL